MIIIIEGPDGSGKTTLAQQLSLQTGFTYTHRSKPKDDEERRNMLKSYYDEAGSGKNMIWDRCWYSEMVYGKVMRDQSVISMEEMLKLEHHLASNGGGLVIHCTDEMDNLWDRLNIRGEDYITSYADLAQIKLEYEMLFHFSQHLLPVTRYELSSLSNV